MFFQTTSAVRGLAARGASASHDSLSWQRRLVSSFLFIVGLCVSLAGASIGNAGEEFSKSSPHSASSSASAQKYSAPCVTPTPPNATSTSPWPFLAQVVPTIELARSTDPVGPFPLDAILPFPWATIEGIWAVKSPDGKSIYWSFKVVPDCNGKKALQVVSFDRQSYQVTAEGLGLTLPNDKMMRATVNTSATKYEVFIRQYKQSTPKGQRQVTVLTVRPFGSDGSSDVHMIAQKKSSMSLEEYGRHQQELQRGRTIHP